MSEKDLGVTGQPAPPHACEFTAFTGVNTVSPTDPAKVWKCDLCGNLFWWLNGQHVRVTPPEAAAQPLTPPQPRWHVGQELVCVEGCGDVRVTKVVYHEDVQTWFYYTSDTNDIDGHLEENLRLKITHKSAPPSLTAPLTKFGNEISAGGESAGGNTETLTSVSAPEQRNPSGKPQPSARPSDAHSQFTSLTAEELAPLLADLLAIVRRVVLCNPRLKRLHELGGCDGCDDWRKLEAAWNKRLCSLPGIKVVRE
jgi:hypothetical protein